MRSNLNNILNSQQWLVRHVNCYKSKEKCRYYFYILVKLGYAVPKVCSLRSLLKLHG